MAHVTLAVIPKIELTPDEYTLQRKALRGELIRDEDKKAARALSDKLDELCASQSNDISKKLNQRLDR